MASLTVHMCLVIVLYMVGYGMEPRAIVYEVSLVGLPHALSMQGGDGVGGSAVVLRTSASTPLVTVSAALPATPPLPLNVTAAAPQPSQISATPPKVRKASPARAARAAAPQRAAIEAGKGEQAGSVESTESAESARRAERGTQGGGQGGMGEVFTVHQVDTMPAVLRRVTPVYPPEAKKQRVEGRVVVRLVVDTTGKAIQYSVHGAEPSGYFEASAVEAVGRMRFSPGKKAGQAVNTLVLLPFDFRLR